MANYKIPIIEKIYEAYSAIADERIKIEEDKFYVTSSDYSKFYTITKTETTYISNDNMSYWKQTIGYPIIAIMMVTGKIDYNKEVIRYFKDINWKKINTEYKNDYVKVAQIILDSMKDKGVDVDFIKTETEIVYNQVKKLELTYIKSKIFPPK